MNALMPLEVVISVEALRADVTFEGTLILLLLLVLMVRVASVKMRHAIMVTSICRHHPTGHATARATNE